MPCFVITRHVSLLPAMPVLDDEANDGPPETAIGYLQMFWVSADSPEQAVELLGAIRPDPRGIVQKHDVNRLGGPRWWIRRAAFMLRGKFLPMQSSVVRVGGRIFYSQPE